ncbi:hypothetical protein [Staphylococcus phage vB_SsapH-Golestan-100]|nr:hypothetical protein [Staphylococcus phage vB_SsapH-Golestan-100]
MAWVYNNVEASGMCLLTIDEIDHKTLVMDFMTEGWYDNTDPNLVLKPKRICPYVWFEGFETDYWFFAPMRFMILSAREEIIEDTDWKYYYTGKDSIPTPGRGEPYPW